MSTRTWHKANAKLLLAMAFVLVFAAGSVMAATSSTTDVTVVGSVGSVTPIAHWKIQSSAKAQQSGKVISVNAFSAQKWHPTTAHATPMAGLLGDGQLRDLLEHKMSGSIFHGQNLRFVQTGNHGSFVIPWWYRAQFDLTNSTKHVHTFLRVNGMIPYADVWLNGHEVVTHTTLRGAFAVHLLDVTRWVHAGVNTVALRVYPANAERNLVISWIDWNPPPPDRNMGPWRGVDVMQTGPVTLRFPQVTSKLSLPKLASAALTVKVHVRNFDRMPLDAIITGNIAGVTLHRIVHLKAYGNQTVIFSPRANPALELVHPKVWWPYAMGGQPLYRLKLTASVNGTVSDHAHTTFGIRSVRSTLTKQGYRRFFINGKPILVRGGGWASDMFLRSRPKRLAAELEYVRNMGLNAIRLEGKLEDNEFYDLADRYGIMIIPGWECCDRWEAAAGTGGKPWSAATKNVARKSMMSEARLLRNHPSVIAFLIGSDHAPPPAIAKMYTQALHATNWPNPIVSAASDNSNATAGPSGLKMNGPYAWVPPSYWYADKLGGAFGFDSEVSAGADIPRLIDLRRMLTPTFRRALWKDPEVRQYHASPFWSPFASLKPFDTALTSIYGRPHSLADYARKAQLANYANVRAQFEAFNAKMNAANPSTGVIYWMLNSAWPSLHWHLFDYYMNPAGAYFGAKVANQPIHIQYSYDSRAIMAINHTLQTAGHLTARIRIYDLDGKLRYRRKLKNIDLAPNHATRLAAIPALKNLSSTYFVELELAKTDGQPISRNVYWLSNQPTQLDWTKSTWYTTPVARYANLTALQKLPSVDVKAKAHTRRDDKQRVTTVTITAPPGNKNVAFFVHLSIRQTPQGKPVTPVLWSGNDESLWPGESITVTANYQITSKASPVVRIEGWNVGTRSVPATHSSNKL